MFNNILMLFGADSTLQWGRSYQLAKAMGEDGKRVFYVDLPSPARLTRSVLSTARTTPMSANCVQYRPLYGLPVARIPALAPINDRVIYTQILAALKKAAFTPDVLWVYTPYSPNVARKLVQRLTPAATVYDCADERVELARLSRGDRVANLVDRQERSIMDLCNMVFAITPELVRRKSLYHHNVSLQPNGIDRSVFAANLDLPKPTAYERASGRVILYTGAIEKWINLDAVAQCARRCPEDTVVMLGPVRVDLSCTSLPANVQFVGPRPYAEVPGFIMHADLCINPMYDTPVTRYCDPLKVLQYLAVGKKVISLRFASVNDYDGFVKVADSESAFVDMVAHSDVGPVYESREAQYEELMEKYTWHNLVRRAFATLEEVSKTNDGS